MASSRSATRRARRNDARAAAAVPVEPKQHPGFWLPTVFTAALAAIAFTPRVQSSPAVTAGFWGAVALLVAMQAALYLRVRGNTADRVLLLPPPKRQHWIQSCVQVSVYLYWGYYWREVYDHAWLIVAQLVFAYAFDMLLSWHRRREYSLGFGPFPIILSINLFLWFRDDWFYLQFLVVAVGFLGKEFVRWHREGKKVHIFNPSAFTLGLFSLLILATGTTNLTWAREIATTLTLAPNIYLFLFLGGLVVMYFFSITLVVGMAAGMLFLLSGVYSAVTGVPYFIDSEIPAAVFLGLHLLITDPSTSPRSKPGKFIFGALYGLSVFVLYALLSYMGLPTFYDKLMAVPLLNLSVRWMDAGIARMRASRFWVPARIQWPPARMNLAHMAIWIVFFGAMAATGRTDGRHTGDSVPFWQQACEEGRRNACEKLLIVTTTYCNDNSAWACNEMGRYFAEGRVVEADPEVAMGYFARACELRFQAGCVNILDPATLAQAPPKPLDLRLLLREGGLNLMDASEPELYARACDHRWAFACETLSGGAGTAPSALVSGG